VPSKFVCCLSHLCLAAMTLRSQFLLCCVDLSRRSDKLRSKWCLSARDSARAPASNSAVILLLSCCSMRRCRGHLERCLMSLRCSHMDQARKKTLVRNCCVHFLPEDRNWFWRMCFCWICLIQHDGRPSIRFLHPNKVCDSSVCWILGATCIAIGGNPWRHRCRLVRRVSCRRGCVFASVIHSVTTFICSDHITVAPAPVHRITCVGRYCYLYEQMCIECGKWDWCHVWCQLGTRWCQFDQFDPQEVELNGHFI